MNNVAFASCFYSTNLIRCYENPNFYLFFSLSWQLPSPDTTFVDYFKTNPLKKFNLETEC